VAKKGELTRGKILDQAVVLASRLGLEGLTLGVLAESLDLSKSGLFAHFRSKEALVLAVLDHTKVQFLEHMRPYLDGKAKGLASLRAHTEAWLDWIALPGLPAGCPLLGASFEVEDIDGPTREAVVDITHNSRARLAELLEQAVQARELREDLPVGQAVFEIRGITLSFHIEHRLLRDPKARKRANRAFEELLVRYAAPSRGKAKQSSQRPTPREKRSQAVR
jgi:AcrR family transcriptional regulator